VGSEKDCEAKWIEPEVCTTGGVEKKVACTDYKTDRMNP